MENLKLCYICKISKAVEEFYKINCNSCKDCAKKKQKDYRPTTIFQSNNR